MRFANILTIIIFLTTLVALVFAWPAFKLDVAGQTIDWDGLNLATVTKDEVKGELQFQEGLDIRGGTKYELSTDIPQEKIDQKQEKQFADDLTKDFAQRLYTYGYTDFNLKWWTKDSKLNVELLLPGTGDDQQGIVSVLSSKGSFSFWTQDPTYKADENAPQGSMNFFTGMKPADLSVKELDAFGSYRGFRANGYGFKLEFSKDAEDNLISTITQETARGTMLVMDEFPVGFRVSGSSGIETGGDTGVVFLSSIYSDGFDLNDAVVTNFKTGEMDANLDLETSNEISPLFGDNYEDDLKFALLLMTILISGLVLIRFKWIGLYQIFNIFVFAVWQMFLLKLFSAQLSFGLVAGSLISFVFMLILLMDLSMRLKVFKGEEVRKVIEQYRNLRKGYTLVTILMGLMSVAILFLGLPYIDQIAGAFGVGLIIFLVMLYSSVWSFLPFTYIKNMRHEKES